MKTSFVRHIVISVAVLVVMILFSACSGLGNGQSTLTGSIVSVDPNTGTVVISVNGQQDTIKNVPASVIQTLQGQVGKVYSVQVTTNSDGSFSIVAGTNVTSDETPSSNETPSTGETPSSNETPTTNEPGTMQFFGIVQSVGTNSLVVTMPTGGTLSFTTNSSTDLSDWPNNGLPGVGTHVKVEVNANTDGSFTATKVGSVDQNNDTTQAEYTGVATAAVGSDHVLHFAVGNKSFSFPIASTADLGDFNGNAQSIQNGANIKVTVQFSGSNGSIIKVSNPNQ